MPSLLFGWLRDKNFDEWSNQRCKYDASSNTSLSMISFFSMSGRKIREVTKTFFMRKGNINSRGISLMPPTNKIQMWRVWIKKNSRASANQPSIMFTHSGQTLCCCEFPFCFNNAWIMKRFCNYAEPRSKTAKRRDKRETTEDEKCRKTERQTWR